MAKVFNIYLSKSAGAQTPRRKIRKLPLLGLDRGNLYFLLDCEFSVKNVTFQLHRKATLKAEFIMFLIFAPLSQMNHDLRWA